RLAPVARRRRAPDVELDRRPFAPRQAPPPSSAPSLPCCGLLHLACDPRLLYLRVSYLLRSGAPGRRYPAGPRLRRGGLALRRRPVQRRLPRGIRLLHDGARLSLAEPFFRHELRPRPCRSFRGGVRSRLPDSGALHHIAASPGLLDFTA